MLTFCKEHMSKLEIFLGSKTKEVHRTSKTLRGDIMFHKFKESLLRKTANFCFRGQVNNSAEG